MKNQWNSNVLNWTFNSDYLCETGSSNRVMVDIVIIVVVIKSSKNGKNHLNNVIWRKQYNLVILIYNNVILNEIRCIHILLRLLDYNCKMEVAKKYKKKSFYSFEVMFRNNNFNS